MRYALLGLLLVPSLAAAQPREVAALYPSGTVAYVELREAAAVADAIAALVKGSPFEDGLKLLHDRKDAARNPRTIVGSAALNGAALITSPEFLGELRKIHGAAIGFFGLAANSEPKVAVCILTGESTAARLLARSYLANEATFRRVAVVDGVPIFQSRALPTQAYDPNTGKPVPYDPKPATEGPCEPTYAYTSGLFIVATNKEAIADVLARFHGAAKDSLATSPGFPANRPVGINAYVRTAELVRIADLAKKAKKDILPAELLGYLKLVLNPRATPVAIANGTIVPQGIRWTIDCQRDPTQASPLLDVFDGPVPAELTQLAPIGAAGTLAWGMTAKSRRTPAVLSLTDAILSAQGHLGRSAKEWSEELERRTKLPLQSRFLSDVRGVAVMFLPKPELPPRVEPLPVLAVQVESDAEQWTMAIPQFFAALDAREPAPQPASEMIRGVKIWTATVSGTPIHFGRRELTWFFGLDRNQVAHCCLASATAPPSAGENVLGSMRWPGLAEYQTIRKLAGQFESRSRVQSALDVPLGGGFLPPGLIDPTADAGDLTNEDFRKFYGTLPPLGLRVVRSENRIRGELRWDFERDGAKGFLVKLIPILERFGTGGSSDGFRLSPFDR